MFQPFHAIAQALDGLEACRHDLDCGLEGDPVDRRATDITVYPCNAAKFLQMARAYDRPSLDHAQGLRRDGANATHDRSDVEGGFLDADFRRYAGDATLVPSQIDVDHVDRDHGGTLRFRAVMDIGDGGKSRLVCKRQHIQLTREAHARLLQQRAEFRIHQDRGREIGDAEETLLDHLVDNRMQVLTRIEDRSAEEDRDRRPRQDLPGGEIHDEAVAFVDRQHGDERRLPHAADTSGAEGEKKVGATANGEVGGHSGSDRGSHKEAASVARANACPQRVLVSPVPRLVHYEWRSINSGTFTTLPVLWLSIAEKISALACTFASTCVSISGPPSSQLQNRSISQVFSHFGWVINWIF